MIVQLRGSRSSDPVEELAARLAGAALREMALVAQLGEHGIDAETMLVLADVHAERENYALLLAQ